MVVVAATAYTQNPLPGSDRDAYGCITSAGYRWCDAKQECIRPFEEDCPVPSFPKEEARMIAQAGICIQNGALNSEIFYNENSQTWWIGIDMNPDAATEGCSPACVVYYNGTSEINWRCTGLLPPAYEGANPD